VSLTEPDHFEVAFDIRGREELGEFVLIQGCARVFERGCRTVVQQSAFL
jgi:hypothetical protein